MTTTDRERTVERALGRLTPQFMKLMDPELVRHTLYGRGLLTWVEYQSIASKTTKVAAVEDLLVALRRRGPDILDELLDVLGEEETANAALIQKIREVYPDPKAPVYPDPKVPVYPDPKAPVYPDAKAPVQESQPPAEASHTSTQHTITLPSQEGVDNAPKVAYQMKAKPRGIGVIINNKKFKSMKDRNGTDRDAKALVELFTFLGFSVRRFDDLKSRDMCRTLKSVADLDHSRYDCLLLAILTHGEEGMLYGTDSSTGDSNLVPVSDITSYFDGNHCPTLIGKPKIFILQACRGGRFDYGVEVESTDAPGAPLPSEADLKELMEEQYEHIIDRTLDDPDETDGGSYSGALPTEADFLLAYATVPGFVSWRNSEFGSWFIKAFCDTMQELASREHLMDIMIEVNRRVAEEFQSRNRNKQIPAPVTMLTRKLYFRPGMYS